MGIEKLKNTSRCDVLGFRKLVLFIIKWKRKNKNFTCNQDLVNIHNGDLIYKKGCVLSSESYQILYSTESRLCLYTVQYCLSMLKCTPYIKNICQNINQTLFTEETESNSENKSPRHKASSPKQTEIKLADGKIWSAKEKFQKVHNWI